MATITLAHWPEMSKAQYEQFRKEVKWETDKQGPKFHTVWFADDGLHAFDLWDSRAHFDGYAQTRLTPAAQRVGIKGQPKVTFAEAHAFYPPSA